MAKLLTCLAFLLIISSFAFSQSIIKGTVQDSSEKKNVTNSVVAVLRKADSVLLAFTRTDKTGNFLLKTNAKGDVILMITHPAYADYIDQLALKENAVNELGNISMFAKSQLLQEVVVSNNGSIRIKGDTIEYKVDSVMMKAGATVEDLLKKLPGFQVDKNGKITAQGVAVEKVLVDGEEFFSDDPTIVTRNMLSDAIDKIQVYDKKSDQAAFTGVDDGQKIKTIDLKLKADRKKGYFGKVELGTDAKQYWNNSAMLNLFQAKRKIAFYGITSNTGKTGLDWNEGTNYGGASMEMIASDGNTYFTSGSFDDFGSGSYYGEGLPKGWNGGAHYSNKWNNDKIHLNANYQFKKLNTSASGSTNSKYILPDTLYYINEQGNSFSSKVRNSLNGIYEYQLDSSSSLKINAQGYTGESISVNHSLSESLSEEGEKVNNSKRNINSIADNKAFNSSLLYRKKFKKTGRTVSMTVNQNYTENQSDGFLDASYNFFNQNGEISNQQVTDQQKLNSGIRSIISSKAVYTEPLSKKAILEFNYALGNSHSHSSITTLEKMLPGGPKYEQVIDSLSNDYNFNVLTNTAGINYRYSRVKKINLSFGGNISRADYTRKDLKTDSTARYDFVNFFPQANVNFTFGQSGNLSFYYNGSTQAPSIDQIQPIRDNSDALNQRIGNPDLEQSFRQRFAVSYNSYKFLSERSIYTSLNYTAISNDFSTINYVKENGQRISQPVNVDGNYYLSGYFNYSKKLKKSGARISVYTNFSKNRNTNYVNEDKNINNSNNISLGTRFYYSKEKKFEISISPSITNNFSKSSIRPEETTQYYTQQHYADLTVFPIKRVEVGTDVMVELRQKTDAFPDNNNVVRWNAKVDRKIMKNDAGIIRFSAFDILNQNLGFQRNISSNFITERTYDTFRRYFLVSFIWNFSKNGKPQEW